MQGKSNDRAWHTHEFRVEKKEGLVYNKIEMTEPPQSRNTVRVTSLWARNRLHV